MNRKNTNYGIMHSCWQTSSRLLSVFNILYSSKDYTLKVNMNSKRNSLTCRCSQFSYWLKRWQIHSVTQLPSNSEIG